MEELSTVFADVSVIIPAYGAADTIDRALKSVAEQTLLPREIIVVDDGSEDETFAVAKSYIGKLNGIHLKVFQQPNAGAGKARNRAIFEATSEFVAFLDADDEWLPEKIAKTMPYFDQINYVFVAHNGWIVDGDSRVLNNCHKRFEMEADPYISLFKRGYIDTCTVVARRHAILAVGGFDETLPNAQDFELWLALCSAPHAQFTVFEDALSLYYLMPESIMSYTKRRMQCCLEIARWYSPEIRRRSNNGLIDLWYRIIAIYYEAFRAYLQKKNLLAVCLLPLKMILSFLSLSISYQRNKKYTHHRTNYLNTNSFL